MREVFLKGRTFAFESPGGFLNLLSTKIDLSSWNVGPNSISTSAFIFMLGLETQVLKWNPIKVVLVI